MPTHDGCQRVLGRAAPPAQPARAPSSLRRGAGPVGPPSCTVWVRPFCTSCLGSSGCRGGWAGCPLPGAAVGAGRMGLGDRYRPACRLRLWFPAGAGGEGVGEPAWLPGGPLSPTWSRDDGSCPPGTPSPCPGGSAGQGWDGCSGSDAGRFLGGLLQHAGGGAGAWAVHQGGGSPTGRGAGRDGTPRRAVRPAPLAVHRSLIGVNVRPGCNLPCRRRQPLPSPDPTQPTGWQIMLYPHPSGAPFSGGPCGV